MIGISGAAANHAKKQMKNAIHVTWKARICGVLKLKRSILVALGSVALMAGEANNMKSSHAHGTAPAVRGCAPAISNLGREERAPMGVETGVGTSDPSIVGRASRVE